MWALFPVVTTRYAMLDDYLLLTDPSYASGPLSTSLYVREGRPLSALWMRLGLHHWNTVGDLAWLRAGAMAGLLLFGGLVYRTLRRSVQLDTPVAAAVALAVCSSPGIFVYTGWATAAPYTWGLAVGLLGGIACLQTPTRNWWRWSTGLLLIALACCIYQPTAAAALLPSWFIAWKRPRSAWKSVLNSGVAYLCACLLYLILLRAALALQWIPGDRKARMGSFSELPGQLLEYFQIHVPYAARSWDVLFGWNLWGWLVGAALIGWSLTLPWRTGVRRSLLRLFLPALLLLMMVGPLAVSGGNAPFRIMAVIAAALGAVPVFLWALLPAPRWLSVGGTVLGAAWMLYSGSLALRQGITGPAAHEYRCIREGLRRQQDLILSQPTGPYHVIRPNHPYTQGFRVYPVYEYGNYTASGEHSWEPQAKWLILDSLGCTPPVPERRALLACFRVVLAGGNGGSGPTPILLDCPSWMWATALPESANAQSDDTYRQSPTGWWLDYGNNWIWHEALGWAQVTVRRPSDWDLYSPLHGMLRWPQEGGDKDTFTDLSGIERISPTQLRTRLLGKLQPPEQ